MGYAANLLPDTAVTLVFHELAGTTDPVAVENSRNPQIIVAGPSHQPTPDSLRNASAKVHWCDQQGTFVWGQRGTCIAAGLKCPLPARIVVLHIAI